jgi:hypothetical protein
MLYVIELVTLWLIVMRLDYNVISRMAKHPVLLSGNN